ncbi:MAG: hypothetical protein ACK5MR_14860 [Cumulibacter sp.]
MAKITRYKRTVDVMGNEVLKEDKTFKSMEHLIKQYPELAKSKEQYNFRQHLKKYEYIKKYKHKNGKTYETVQRRITYKGYV